MSSTRTPVPDSARLLPILLSCLILAVSGCATTKQKTPQASPVPVAVSEAPEVRALPSPPADGANDTKQG